MIRSFIIICGICVLAFAQTQKLSEMMQFIDASLNPSGGNCSGLEFVISDMGTGGGFAAHMQLAASEWMRAFKLVNFEKPVIIIGHIWRYSEGRECKKSGYDWTCFFQPMSRCQNELLKSGKQIQVQTQSVELDDKLVPERFRELGLWPWWGAIQAYMFHRMQPRVLAYVAERSVAANFPYLLPALPYSGNNIHNLFNISTAHTRGTGPVAGLHVRHGDKSSDGFRHHSLSSQAAHIIKSNECLKETNRSHSGSPACIVTDAEGKFSQIPVFVASDDPKVVKAAEQAGFTTLHSSLSLQTADRGMFAELGSHPEMGFNASLEIIADIFLLSRCSTLIGIASSQVFRMAADLSMAAGTLRYLVAMDHDQLPRMHAMSRKYHLPTPERFEAP